MSRLLLIDGNAILHRSYHALPPLPDEHGKPTGAIYGFFSILIKLYQDFKPGAVAVAFDRPAPTFRKKLFKAYQQQRPKMDDDLSVQITKVHEMLGECGIPIFELDGYEADDILGTMSREISNLKSQIPNKSKAQNPKKQTIDQVIIVTGDRDLLQLVVDERVLVFMPTKGLSEGTLYGEKDVILRMGVPPSQVADLKALTGDSSDNYPGVSGIGPKTATELLKTYGSIEKIFKNLDSIPQEKIREKLKSGTHDAVLFKNIATIRTDVPIGQPELKPVDTLDTLRVRAALERFPSLVRRIRGEVVEIKKKDEKKIKVDPSEQLSLV